MPAPHTIIFGGTRGMGRVLAGSLRAKGQCVTVLGRSKPEAGADAAGHVTCDVANADSLRAALDTLKRDRPAPNHLVFFQRWRGEGDRWHGEVETALSATRTAIESLADSFAPGPDRAIVLVSSIASRFIASDQPLAYHLAKAGMIQLVNYFAVTLGPRLIRVNAVSPGTTVKPESAQYYAGQAPLQELYRQITPLGRLGQAEDVTGVVEFLCSPASAFMTGQNLFVDGGVSLHSQESLARRLAKL